MLHARALPSTHATDIPSKAIIEDTQNLTGREIERGYVDKRYRGRDTENPRRIIIANQKCVRRHQARTAATLRHRARDRPDEDGRPLGRYYLKGRAGDAANAILSAVGYKFRILAWLSALLHLFLIAFIRLLISLSALIPAS